MRTIKKYQPGGPIKKTVPKKSIKIDTSKKVNKVLVPQKKKRC